uniref:Uncharacterized protein n=1 Tax=viral metagenome TaxID=1070528 RepID=A0A6C0BAS3_9ZZZZ
MSQIRIIPGKRSRTCATSQYANQMGQTIFNGNIICTDSGNLITNKEVNANSDVIVNRTQVERATNSILYSTSGRTQFGNFGTLAEVQTFLKNNQTTPGIYTPYVYLDPKSPAYNYYVNYSTQPNRIPGIRNRF